MSDPVTFQLPEGFVDVIADRVARILADRQGASSPRRWLTADEAAAYIGAKPKRIYDLRSSGRLSRTGDGTRVLVDRHELDRLVGGV